MKSAEEKLRRQRGLCLSDAWDGSRFWCCEKKPGPSGYCCVHDAKAVARRQVKKDAHLKKRMLETDDRIKMQIEFQRRALAYPRLMKKIRELKVLLKKAEA